MPSSAPRQLTLPERLLRALADVRPGEGRSAALLLLNIFLLLTAYYVMKSVREGLIVGGARLVVAGTVVKGDQLKIYAASLMTLLLLAVVPAYGWLASRVSRLRLINISVALVIACLGVFWLWGRASGPGLGIGLTYFVWLGIVNVFLIAQFWSYANDVYAKEQGERLFAIVALGQSAGAIVGGLIASELRVSVFLLLVVAAALLSASLALYNLVDRHFGARSQRPDDGGAGVTGADERAERPLSREGAFRLVFRTKYLLLIAFMLLCNNLVNTTGEYILANAAEEYTSRRVPDLRAADALLANVLSGADQAESRNWPAERRIKQARSQVTSRFYGQFYLFVNIVGTLIQAFFVSRIIKFLGVRAALFILPLIALGGYGLIASFGGLLVLRLSKTAENSVDYSLQNTLKQAVFLVTSREAKYKAKVAIDTAFVRFGDVSAGALIFVGLHLAGLQTRGFALINVLVCLLWLLLVRGIAREHERLEQAMETEATPR